MAQMLFYQRIVALDGNLHSQLRYQASADFGFARGVNSVPLVAGEFALALKHYPIVFARGKDEAILPLALLGLEDGVNGFVNADGGWLADYVPAFVRRYPFVAAQHEDGREMVCFDEASPRFSQTEGDPLFVPGVEQTPLMARVMELLSSYHQQAALTQQFCRRLQELDWLEQSEVTFSPPQSQSRKLGGFLVIKEERLKACTPQQAHELLGTGALALIYAHLMSLSNIPRIPGVSAPHVAAVN